MGPGYSVLVPAEVATLFILTVTTSALLFFHLCFLRKRARQQAKSRESTSELARIRWWIQLWFALASFCAALAWVSPGLWSIYAGGLTYTFLAVAFTSISHHQIVIVSFLVQSYQPRCWDFGLRVIPWLFLLNQCLAVLALQCGTCHLGKNPLVTYAYLGYFVPALLVLMFTMLDGYSYIHLRRRLSLLKINHNSQSMQRVHATFRSAASFHVVLNSICLVLFGLLLCSWRFHLGEAEQAAHPVSATAVAPSASQQPASSDRLEEDVYLSLFTHCKELGCVYQIIALLLTWYGVFELKFDSCSVFEKSELCMRGGRLSCPATYRLPAMDSSQEKLVPLANFFLGEAAMAHDPVSKAARTRAVLTVGTCTTVLPLLAVLLQLWARRLLCLVTLTALLYAVLTLKTYKTVRAPNARIKRLLPFMTVLVVYACVVCGTLLSFDQPHNNIAPSPFNYLHFLYIWLSGILGESDDGRVALAAYLCNLLGVSLFWALSCINRGSHQTHLETIVLVAVSSFLVNVSLGLLGTRVTRSRRPVPLERPQESEDHIAPPCPSHCTWDNGNSATPMRDHGNGSGVHPKPLEPCSTIEEKREGKHNDHDHHLAARKPPRLQEKSPRLDAKSYENGPVNGLRESLPSLGALMVHNNNRDRSPAALESPNGLSPRNTAGVSPGNVGETPSGSTRRPFHFMSFRNLPSRKDSGSPKESASPHSTVPALPAASPRQTIQTINLPNVTLENVACPPQQPEAAAAQSAIVQQPQTAPPARPARSSRSPPSTAPAAKRPFFFMSFRNLPSRESTASPRDSPYSTAQALPALPTFVPPGRTTGSSTDPALPAFPQPSNRFPVSLHTASFHSRSEENLRHAHFRTRSEGSPYMSPNATAQGLPALPAVENQQRSGRREESRRSPPTQETPRLSQNLVQFEQGASPQLTPEGSLAALPKYMFIPVSTSPRLTL